MVDFKEMNVDEIYDMFLRKKEIKPGQEISFSSPGMVLINSVIEYKTFFGGITEGKGFSQSLYLDKPSGVLYGIDEDSNHEINALGDGGLVLMLFGKEVFDGIKLVSYKINFDDRDLLLYSPGRNETHIRIKHKINPRVYVSSFINFFSK